MADVRCPMCGKLNPPELEACQFCGARIKPILASKPLGSIPIRAGDQPVKSNASEFEKAKPGESGPIHPGEIPTKKNTAELERALPSWLRSLREGKNSSETESQAGQSTGESLPPVSGETPASDSSGGLPDWLTGLDKSASEEELSPELGSSDWMARLSGEPQAPASGPPISEPPVEVSSTPTPSKDLSPDWLKSLQSTESSVQEPPASTQGKENLPDWTSGFPGISAESNPVPSDTGEPAAAQELPDWLKQLQEKGTGVQPVEPVAGSESVPDWLSGLEAGAGVPPTVPTAGSESVPDWLSGLEAGAGAPPTVPTAGGESVPDWLSGLESDAGQQPAASAGGGEAVPDWLSNLEEKSDSKPESSSALLGDKQQPVASTSETPGWLSRLHADINAAEEVEKHKDDFEVVSGPSVQPKEAGPLPEWLAGIERTASPSGSTPALIADDQDNVPGETGETAFSMEAPDWLSKLKPEQVQGIEKATTSKEEPTAAGDIEAAELPSWVQAMRPVESVVADAKPAVSNEEQVTEQSGPLAGLVGVLPPGPGLGSLRKPPAYSVKLQMTESQQRYVNYFDRLLAGETHPHDVKAAGLASNWLWRWLITLLLVVAVTLPLVTNLHVTPPISLQPTDKSASFALVQAIPVNSPVLVAFDYAPALSGELEAAAAPLFDQLLSKNIRLTLVSTSPTGPMLAERFLQFTPLVNTHQYSSGEQYVNLGYLAGGSAGISYFASDPAAAMPDTTNGDPAWTTPPLKGVLRLSDFSAIIILTDNADTGRNWIEQSSQFLGKTPMMMIISAQAEPMIQPYFDSGQLKGLVAGLSDAKIYEETYGRPGLAYHYWDSFSIGMLVVEILIVIGAVWGAAVAWYARRNDTGEKA